MMKISPLLATAALFCAGCAPSNAQLAPVTELATEIVAEPLSPLQLASDPMLEAALYRAYVATPENRVKFDPKTFAVGVNIDWEQAAPAERDDKTGKRWFIEQQAYGADIVQAGIVAKDAKTRELGWKILDWGFDKQGEDGGFIQVGDDFHSTSFFLEGAARALLLSREAKTDDYDQKLKIYLPKIEAAVRWMIGQVLPSGIQRNQPYTHRRFVVSTGWASVAALTKDENLKTQLLEAATKMAREGIGLQTQDGTLPEKGGFDVNYQAVSAQFAARLMSVHPDASLRAQLATLINRALSRASQTVDAKGNISLEGSTRTATEVGRSGKPKKVDMRTWAQAFVVGAKITGKSEYRAIAWRSLIRNQWLDGNWKDAAP